MQDYYIYLWLDQQYVKCALLTAYEDHYELEYGRKYLEKKQAIPIDPYNLPLYPKKFTNEKLFGVLVDISPDRWGRYLLSKKFGRELSELEYVLANGLNHVGALAISPVEFNSPVQLSPDRSYNNHQTPDLQLDLIINQTEQLLLNDSDLDSVNALLSYGSSLGGARPKHTLMLNGDPYLAKFSTSLDHRREPLIEYACMTLANDIGLNVPTIHLNQVTNHDVFFIRRFDRKRCETEIIKLPFISALSLCNWDERDYYEWSYLYFAEKLKQIGRLESEIRIDLKELYKRIILNVAINNDDDHPRNHGVIYQGNSWRLAPLYDVVSKGVSTHNFNLAMEFGTLKRKASRQNLLSAHSYFMLNKSEASELINQIFSFVEINWRTYFLKTGLTVQEVDEFNIAMSRKED